MKEINARELASWLADASLAKPTLLDVREADEVALCKIAGSIPMPMQSIPARLDELNKDAPIVCICHHGRRSGMVARFLVQHGFVNVINLMGGIHAWATDVDPNMAQY